MYDLPEVRDATDALWSSIAEALRAYGVDDVPTELSRGDGDGRLVLDQVCGYPYAQGKTGLARLVATPRYTAPGCDGPTYRTVVVVRKDDAARQLEDLRDRVCSRNERGSHSGDNILRYVISRLAIGGRFFKRVIESGSHEESVKWVRDGRADVAGIDCVSWALLSEHRPRSVEGLRILYWTDPAPALPYVTSIDPAVVRMALLEAVRAPRTETARRALLLGGVDSLGDDAYRPLLDLEAAAQAAGYPELR